MSCFSIVVDGVVPVAGSAVSVEANWFLVLVGGGIVPKIEGCLP
jgi:hypothetical protein